MHKKGINYAGGCTRCKKRCDTRRTLLRNGGWSVGARK